MAARPRHLRSALRLAVAGMALLAAFVGGCKDDSQRGHGSRFEAIGVFGGPGSTPGTFTIPRAIATDGRFLYVVDKSARIQKLDPDTGKCLAWWKTPISELGKPTGLTIAAAPPPVVRGGMPAGTNVLYVADTHYNRVLIYPLAPEGDAAAAQPAKGDVPAAIASLDFSGGGPAESHPPILAQFGTYGTNPGEFIYITDVAVLMGPDGKTVERLYTSEYGGNDRIQCFDGDFKPLWQVGSMGASDSAATIQMERPQVLEIDEGRRELLVTDTRNHRIGRFTLDGALVKWFGSSANSGPGDGGFRYPWSLYQMGDGTVLVVEFGNNRISRVDLETGEILETMGEPGRLAGQFASPWMICGIGDRLFVVDMGNNRIQALKRPPNRPKPVALDGAAGAAGRGRTTFEAQSVPGDSQERIKPDVDG